MWRQKSITNPRPSDPPTSPEPLPRGCRGMLFVAA